MRTDNLVKAVEDSSIEGFSGWRFLELAGYGVGAANLPLGLVMVIGATVAESLAHSRKLSETKMPDTWIQEVADNPHVSKKGLAHLARCIEKNGFVTAKDAVRWTEIERTEEGQREKILDRAEHISSPGALSLLKRADRECGEMLGDGFLRRATEALPTVKDIANLASDASGLFSKATGLFRR